jgi:hypothetical protein
VADYQASGGIRDAIARTAESVYANLSGPEREAARLLFLRLVLVTDDATESRRRVPLNELAGSADPVPSGDVLWEFVGQRLITVTEDIAEISHEALLTAWPRLREWIKAGRDGLRVRRRISDRAHIWQDAGRDFAVLPRGGELAIIRDWTQDPADKASLSGVRPGIRRCGDRARARRGRSGAPQDAQAAAACRGADGAGAGHRRAGRLCVRPAPGSQHRTRRRRLP